MLIYAGICWFGAWIAGGPAWRSWSTSKVPLIMMAYQHSLGGDDAEEAGHQHPMLVTSIQSPAFHAGAGMLITSIPCTSMGSFLPMLAGDTCAWVLFNQDLDLPHLSAGWLILLDLNKCVLNNWKMKLFCVHTKEKLYKIVNLKLGSVISKI